ncbi:unnamed protein product [Cuscuta campestris]|uniref:Protein kinase domain-containing protein n=1 Tax=Cuscuta campestris TaxID=132261 RepID=A0A484MDF6_9ASTE|nr:unnamed protein product [Cuscuta campestris]
MSDDPIGTDSDGSPVYRVAFSVFHETSGERSFVALKTVSSGSSVPETLSRNLNLPGDHKNLTRVEAHFDDGATGDLCIVTPFFEPGSLRSAMAAKFPHGLPEDCISVSLRCALKALRFLHSAGALHGDIHAGHIYLKSGPQITLGFGATLYEHGASDSRAECSSSSSLPATQISTWAAAPEVYNSEDSRGYSEKSDIWLVGITALELAYGRVSVPNRETLEMTIRTITETKRLPKKLGPEGQQRAVAAGRDDRKGKAKMETTDFEEEEEGSSFSREFGELVAQCLAWNPEERPSVDALLNHDFFCKNGLSRRELKSNFQHVLIRKIKGKDFHPRTPNRKPKSHISIPGSTARAAKPPDLYRGFIDYDLNLSQYCLPSKSAKPLKIRITGPKRKLPMEEDKGKPDEAERPRKVHSAVQNKAMDQQMRESPERESSPEESSWISLDDLQPGYVVDPAFNVVYQIMSTDPIGKSGHDDLPVYRVAYSECEDDPCHRKFVYNDFLSAKIVNISRNLAGYTKLRRALRRNETLLKDHPNLMQVEASFFDTGARDFCVVMAFAEWGSLRTILADHFRQGFPETCIALVLKLVLEGVCFLHENGIVHGDINAGHVYVQSGPNIKLGYAATVYDHRARDLECSTSSSLPETDISSWAAAPEVYDRHAVTTEESDVWLVGMLALELAYGGIRVPDREALGVMVRGINATRALPKGLGRGKRACREEAGKGKGKMEDTGEEEEEEERTFSRGFEKMVAECVAWDPRERPTARRLLGHEFFRENGMKESLLEAYFEEVVIERLRK